MPGRNDRCLAERSRVDSLLVRWYRPAAKLVGPTVASGYFFSLQVSTPIIWVGVSRGEQFPTMAEVSVRVQPGDRIFCLSAGGGGFGDPQDRPPDKRAWDVKNGYCSSAEPA